MNTIERIKMVKAMEFITRQLNDEEVFEIWLQEGVADGDIEYGTLDVQPDDAEDMEYYIEDVHFADLMDTFLVCMKKANRSGGLYCDNVVSKAEDRSTPDHPASV